MKKYLIWCFVLLIYLQSGYNNLLVEWSIFTFVKNAFFTHVLVSCSNALVHLSLILDYFSGSCILQTVLHYTILLPGLVLCLNFTRLKTTVLVNRFSMDRSWLEAIILIQTFFSSHLASIKSSPNAEG